MTRTSSTFTEWLLDWRGYLAVLLLSISGAALRLYGQGYQKYSDFVAGHVAWQSLNKSIDNQVLALFFIIFTAGLLLCNLMLVRLKKRFPQTDTTNDLQFLLLVASCPAIWLTGNSIFLKPPIPTSLLTGSSISIALVVFFSAAVLFRVKDQAGERVNVVEIVAGSIVVLLSAGFGALAILTILVRGVLIQSVGNFQTVQQSVGGSVGLGLLALTIVWARSRSAAQLRRRIMMMILGLQLLLPGLYFLLIPSPWLVDGALQRGYAPTKWLGVLIGALVCCTYADIGMKLARWRTRQPAMTFSDAFSPLAMMAVVLLFKMPLLEVSSIPVDDYHFGENLLPAFLWLQHHLTGFMDYDPAKGLFQTLHGLLANVFFDGTAAAINQIWVLINALFAIALMMALAPLVGPLASFFILLLCPFWGAPQFVPICTGAFILLLPALIKRRLAWCAVWSVGTVMLSLFSPQYGPPFGLAAAPIACYMLFQEYQRNWRTLMIFGTLMVTLASLACVLTSLGGMCVGMLRYILENFAVNTTANGVPWLEGWNNAEHPLGAMLWEVSRATMLGVLLLILVLLIREITSPNKGGKESRLIILTVWGGILLLLIPYGVGRIDPGSYSRIGQISVYCASIVLPFILFFSAQQSDKTHALLLSVVAASIVSGGMIPQLAPWQDIFLRPVHLVVPDKNKITDGHKIGLPMIGTGYVDQEHLERLARLKSSLAILLKPGETYLDLTNRQAQYFYMDKPVPIQSGAVYNLPSSAMQTRALQLLAKVHVPAVLISANNQLQDGGPVSLRSYLLYREFMLHYVPIVLNDLVFLVESDRIPYVNTMLAQNHATATIAPLELLNSIFVPDNLNLLPVAWGQSFSTLSDKLTNHIAFDAAPRQTYNARPENDAWLVPEKDAPAILYDISSSTVSGKGAGMLTFDFECQRVKEGPVLLEVYWKPAQQDSINETAVVRFQATNGTLMVPIDIAPKWLLADRIDTVKIGLQDSSSCSKFRVRNLSASQRVSAIEADAVWVEAKQTAMATSRMQK